MSIVSLSTQFKNNIPYGLTNIIYENGTSISTELNNFGFYCGIQKYFYNNKIFKIKNLALKNPREWVKYNDLYFNLQQNGDSTNTLSTLGNQNEMDTFFYALSCDIKGRGYWSFDLLLILVDSSNLMF